MLNLCLSSNKMMSSMRFYPFSPSRLLQPRASTNLSHLITVRFHFNFFTHEQILSRRRNMSTSVTIPVQEHRSPKKLSRQKSFCIFPSYLLHIRFISFLGLFIIVVVVIQNQALKNPGPLISSTSSSPWNFLQRWERRLPADQNCSRMLENATARLSNMVEFLPLKDLRFANTAMEGNTWFMSSIDDTVDGDMSEYIQFPSESTQGRVLCIAGNDKSNGTRNSYALAWPDSLPRGATLLRGLTLVSDTYYDYANIWHGLSATVPIVGWHKMKGCVIPERLVLYHWGELRTSMGNWVQTVLDATFNGRIPIETLDRGTKPTCFEEAVVFRHNEGRMPKLKRREVYDLMRCRARKYCNITATVASAVRMTLFLRNGERSFKNDTAVIEIFEKECGKIDGCQVVVVRPDNMTFCDQVKLMGETDVLVSQHGAQLTNMIFMDRNSSVMEFFPKGWLELAGVGQYVHHWIANWAGMRHEGAWRDEKDNSTLESESCSYPAKDPRCFTLYKGRQIGHDEAYFTNWTKRVLSRAKQYKHEKEMTGTSGSGGRPETTVTGACSCGNH